DPPARVIPEAAGLRDHSSGATGAAAGPWVAWDQAAAMRRAGPVDLQEKRQLDLARQVAKVKAQARPWRAIIALVLAVAAAIVSFTADSITPNHVLEQVLAIGGAGAFCLLAVIAAIGVASKSRGV